MPRFSVKSNRKLRTCHNELQLLCNRVIERIDIIILCGARSLYEQQQLYKNKKTLIDGVSVKSKHQVNSINQKSMAVDIAPWNNGINWKDLGSFRKVANIMFDEWQKLMTEGKVTHHLEWGGTWKSLNDMPHYQLNKK